MWTRIRVAHPPASRQRTYARPLTWGGPPGAPRRHTTHAPCILPLSHLGTLIGHGTCRAARGAAPQVAIDCHSPRAPRAAPRPPCLSAPPARPLPDLLKRARRAAPMLCTRRLRRICLPGPNFSPARRSVRMGLCPSVAPARAAGPLRFVARPCARVAADARQVSRDAIRRPFQSFECRVAAVGKFRPGRGQQCGAGAPLRAVLRPAAAAR